MEAGAAVEAGVKKTTALLDVGDPGLEVLNCQNSSGKHLTAES